MEFEKVLRNDRKEGDYDLIFSKLVSINKSWTKVSILTDFTLGSSD